MTELSIFRVVSHLKCFTDTIQIEINTHNLSWSVLFLKIIHDSNQETPQSHNARVMCAKPLQANLLTKIKWEYVMDKYLHRCFSVGCNYSSMPYLHGLAQPQLKLWHWWAITSHIFYIRNYLSSKKRSPSFQLLHAGNPKFGRDGMGFQFHAFEQDSPTHIWLNYVWTKWQLHRKCHFHIYIYMYIFEEWNQLHFKYNEISICSHFW